MVARMLLGICDGVLSGFLEPYDIRVPKYAVCFLQCMFWGFYL